MKDALKRAAQLLGITPAAPVAETVQTEATDVVTEALDAVADNAALTELQAKFDEQAAALTTALAELAETKAALTEVVQDAAKAEADALAAKLAARKEAVVAALGTERADAFMVAAEAMGDAQFSAVMEAINVGAKNEADKPEFKEVGVDAQADVDALVAEASTSGTGAILKAKYQQTAAN